MLQQCILLFKIIKKTNVRYKSKERVHQWNVSYSDTPHTTTTTTTRECSMINSRQTTLLNCCHMTRCTLIGTESSALATPPHFFHECRLEAQVSKKFQEFLFPNDK